MAGIHKSAVKIEILPVDLITGFNPKITQDRRKKQKQKKPLHRKNGVSRTLLRLTIRLNCIGNLKRIPMKKTRLADTCLTYCSLKDHKKLVIIRPKNKKLSGAILN
jgi:hypothetical protein